MKTIIFNGNVQEFDYLYFGIMQGFEQWITSDNTDKSTSDKVRVMKSNCEIVCIRWII